MRHSELNQSAAILARMILASFPEWERYVSAYGPIDDPEAELGSIQVAVPSPTHPTHFLRILLRGNAVEVAYDDSQPPGPAEKLFIFEPAEVEPAAREIVTFLQALVAEKVAVVREPIGPIVRFLRSDNASDIPRFRYTADLPETEPEGLQVVYSWKGRHSRPAPRGEA